MNALLEYFTKNDCSIREYQSTMHLSAQFAASIHWLLYWRVSIYFHGIKLHSLKYPPNMLALRGMALQPIMLFIMLAYLAQA